MTAQNIERSMEIFVAKLKASKLDWVTVCETEGKRVGLAAIQLGFFAEQIRKQPSACEAFSSSGGGAAGVAAGSDAAGPDAAASLALATVPPPPTPAEQRTVLLNKLQEAREEKRKLGGRRKNMRKAK